MDHFLIKGKKVNGVQNMTAFQNKNEKLNAASASAILVSLKRTPQTLVRLCFD
jgi:hypothetical protein